LNIDVPIVNGLGGSGLAGALEGIQSVTAMGTSMEASVLLVAMGLSGALAGLFALLEGSRWSKVGLHRAVAAWTLAALVCQVGRYVQVTTVDPEVALGAARAQFAAVFLALPLIVTLANRLAETRPGPRLRATIGTLALLGAIISASTDLVIAEPEWRANGWDEVPYFGYVDGPLNWLLGVWSLAIYGLAARALWSRPFLQRLDERPLAGQRHGSSRVERRVFIGSLAVYLCLGLVDILDGMRVIHFPTTYPIAFLSLALGMAIIVSRRVRGLDRLVSAHAATLERQNDELEVARRRAEAASDARATFIAKVSHELRTPLAGVLGMVELLRDSPLTALQTTYLEQLASCGDTLRSLIEDVLDLARIDRGEFEIEHVAFDPLSVAEDVVRAVAIAAHGKGLDLILAPDPGLPARLVGDASRLRQVVLNLAGNAVKYTETGHIRVEVTCAPETGVLVFAVEDTGPGVPEHLLQAIFEPFVQGRPERSARSGLGLGLGIVRELTNAMGGEVTLTSEVGRGARFEVKVALPVADPRPLAARLGPSVEAARARGAQILWVDGGRVGPGSMEAAWGPVVGSGEAGPVRFVASVEALEGGAGATWVVPSERVAAAVQKALALPGERPWIVGLVALGEADGAKNALEAGADEVALRPVLARGIEAILEARGVRDMRAIPESQRSGEEARARVPVLVVEDHLVNRMVIRRLCESWGAVVTESGTVAEARARFATGQFTLIVVDGDLPDGNGFDLGRELREIQGYRGAILGLTASGLPSDIERARVSGFDEIIFKPFDPAALRVSYQALVEVGQRNVALHKSG
jgi:signal transduction histidine kinase/CheY-like chemotaxis protein